jgi:protein-S-isoprenylcysteine O-methyltransferase Ste14
LRDESGQAVTITTVTEGQVIVLDLVQGRTVVEFGVRRGTQMGLHCSSHGKVSLAFGPASLLEKCLKGPLESFSTNTVTSPALLQKQIAQIKKQGWATAANEVLFGVNALAAPIFDHRGAYAGAIAIVGSTQYIGAKPDAPQLAMVQDAGVSWLVWVGAAVWLLGFVFESVGDWQLTRFRNDPDSNGTVLDTGLWRYTRHPNYFGDFCVWWGIFLVAAETGPGRWGVIGPVVMTVFLLRVSGVALLERDIGHRRPAYADYVARTSAFFPWKPKPGLGASGGGSSR